MPLGLMAGMLEEIDAVVQVMRDQCVHERAGRRFIHGTLHGVPLVAVFSRWGKVAASSTATELILSHGVDRLIFSGVAGSLRPEVALGDIVIANHLIQHDFNASPFFPPRVIPLLEAEFIPTDASLSSQLKHAAETFLQRDAPTLWQHPTQRRPPHAKLHQGDIATGDQFIATQAARLAIQHDVPSALCVEMEGAAVAQVCFEHNVPFACVRTISDAADEAAEHHFIAFIKALASAYTAGIISTLLRQHTASSSPT